MWAEVKHTRNICNLISHLGNSGPRAYQNETGLHREECLMLSDRIQTQFPALTWRLKTTPNSSSRNPMLSSDLQGTRHACIHMVCRHRCRQSTSEFRFLSKKSKFLYLLLMGTSHFHSFSPWSHTRYSRGRCSNVASQLKNGDTPASMAPSSAIPTAECLGEKLFWEQLRNLIPAGRKSLGAESLIHPS